MDYLKNIHKENVIVTLLAVWHKLEWNIWRSLARMYCWFGSQYERMGGYIGTYEIPKEVGMYKSWWPTCSSNTLWCITIPSKGMDRWREPTSRPISSVFIYQMIPKQHILEPSCMRVHTYINMHHKVCVCVNICITSPHFGKNRCCWEEYG